MAKELRCRDLGLNCDFEARGDSEEDVLGQASDHARSVHQIPEIPPELAAKARAVMRTV